MSRVVRNIRFVVPLPAEEHLCSKRRDQKCKTLWGGYADDPGTDGARHWAKWRGDRAEATGQRARPKAEGQSCTLATPRGSSIRVPIGRLSPEAFSRGVFASGRETLPQRENWLSPPHPERPNIPDPSLKRQIPRATGSPNLATWAFCPALLPNRSNALRSSS